MLSSLRKRLHATRTFEETIATIIEFDPQPTSAGLNHFK